MRASAFVRLALLGTVALGACMPPSRLPDPGAGGSGATAEGRFRIVAPGERTELAYPQMIDRLADADVVFFGEQHDDPETHRAEAMVLESLGRVGRPVVLSLEMFERDVQPALDDYLAGRISEADLLSRSRPWPRYATDYRPLVELAKARGWPVVAANVPRPLASAVGRKGMAALDTLSSAERLHAARDNLCPADDYHARFMEQMQGHGAGARPRRHARPRMPGLVARGARHTASRERESPRTSDADRARAPGHAFAKGSMRAGAWDHIMTTAGCDIVYRSRAAGASRDRSCHPPDGLRVRTTWPSRIRGSKRKFDLRWNSASIRRSSTAVTTSTR